MPRLTKKRRISPSSSSHKPKIRTKKYNIPKNPIIDQLGVIQPPKSHPHKTRSRDGSSTSQRSNMSTSSSTRATQPQKGSSKPTSSNNPKPVFVNSGILSVKNSLLNITFSSPPLLKMAQPNKTQVICATSEDKTKLIEKLVALKFMYHTFTDSHQKPMLYVLKGHYRVTCDELKTELDEANVPTTKVTFLWDHPERPLYIVHFERGKTNLNTLNNTAKAVGSVIVKWHRFDTARKRLTQCHNCQQYGHSATNCGHKYRCIKCLNEHLPGQCLRKTKDDEGTPKCVNCQGDHAANSRQCSHFISYSEMVQRQKSNRQSASRLVSNRHHQGYPAQQALPAAAVAPLNRANFPNLPLRSHSHNVNSNLNGLSFDTPTFAKISSLQARLAAVSDMSEVFEKFEALVLQLESAQTVEQKLQILITNCLPNNAY